MEEDIAPLLRDISAILAKDALFVVLTSYAIRSSFLSLHHLMDDVFGASGEVASGEVQSGELSVREETGRGYRLGQAIFSRWQAG